MAICRISMGLFVSLIVVHEICRAGNDMPNGKNDSLTINAYGLATRVLKHKADQFIFERIDKNNSADLFEISGCNGKILIKGNNGISMASGLNWYLKKYCKVQFSIIDEQLNLPDKLPRPTSTEQVRTTYNYRYFFNVCTFSYTMAWWDWKQWERQIDWMAMNGVNLMLLSAGELPREVIVTVRESHQFESERDLAK